MRGRCDSCPAFGKVVKVLVGYTPMSGNPVYCLKCEACYEEYLREKGDE